MGSFSIWHWLIVLLIVLLVFGTKRLKNIGEDLGGAVRGFKEGMKSAEEKAAEAAPPEAPRPAARKLLTKRPRGGMILTRRCRIDKANLQIAKQESHIGWFKLCSPFYSQDDLQSILAHDFIPCAFRRM